MTVNPAASERRSAAFTLIELLVVVAILALLLSILTPSLQRASALAMTVTCQSNLKPIGVAISTYELEHNGWRPNHVWPKKWINNVENGEPDWPKGSIKGFGVLAPYVAHKDEEYHGYGRGPKVYMCPAWDAWVGYAWNHHYADTKYAFFPTRVDNVACPLSRRGMILDSRVFAVDSTGRHETRTWTCWWWSDPLWSSNAIPDEFVPRAHMGTGPNVLFADLHVDHRDQDDLIYMPGGRPFWLN